MRLLHEIAIFKTVKSKVIISLFETVKLSVSISLRNLYNSLNSMKETLIFCMRTSLCKIRMKTPQRDHCDHVAQTHQTPRKGERRNAPDPSEPGMFVQRLPNVFQTFMTFGTRWVFVVQTSLVHWDNGRLEHVG